MIYPSFKLSLLPTLDKIIEAGIEVKGLLAKSTHSGFKSGKITNYLTEGRQYEIHKREILSKYELSKIKLKKSTPLIAIDSKSEKRDIWAFSNIYLLQVRFDIFGAYISTTKQNRKNPKTPFFTAREILERQDFWRDKRGLMLYPKEDEVEAVANQLSQIKTIIPEK